MVVTMRKVRVFQRKPARLGWAASVAEYDWVGKEIKVYAIAHVATWPEAMFLAQLLADPHEYIRAAQEKAWIGGWWVRDREEIGPNPYDEKDRINDNDNA